MSFFDFPIWILLPFLSLISTAASLPSSNTRLSRRDEWFGPNGDWRAQLKCEGFIPEQWAQIELPDNRYAEMSDVAEPESLASYTTPRRLCAEVQYGGSPIWNAGGWCDFQEGRTAHAVYSGRGHHGLKPADYADILIFCTLRCQCLPYDARLDDPPRSEFVSRPAEVISESESSPHPPYTINFEGASSLQAIAQPPEVTVEFHQEPYDSTNVILEPDESHKIHFGTRYINPICKGPIPEWRLPEPFATFKDENPESYGDVNRLCKAIIFGGEIEGNAGGICVRSSGGRSPRLGDTESLYRFELEEYFAHPSFMWKNGDLGIAVQAWCQRACTCHGSFNPFEDLPISVTTRTGQNNVFTSTVFPKGGVSVVDGERQVSLVEGIPGSVFNKYAMCSVEDTAQVCYGEAAAAAAAAARTWSSSSASGEYAITEPIYGKRCFRSSDCAKRRSDPYRCIANPDAAQLAALGLEPPLSAPISRCLLKILPGLMFGAGMLASKSTGESSGLNGRGILLQEQMACRCNETFVAVACCEQLDGLVEAGTDLGLLENL